MDCTICKNLPEKIVTGFGEKPPPQVEKLKIVEGYYSDRYDLVLKKCPECDTFYVYEHADSFESGGAVSSKLERIPAAEVKKVLEEIEGYKKNEAL